MVAGHFFLFGNVFLVWRRWEYAWAAIFILNFALHLWSGSVTGLSVLLWQMPVTIAVIALQMRSRWHHGILARQINSHRDEYLRGN